MSGFVEQLAPSASTTTTTSIAWMDALAAAGSLCDEVREEIERECGADSARAAELLVERGHVSRRELTLTRAETSGLPFTDLSEYRVNLDNRAFISEETARRMRAFPLFRLRRVITLVVGEPLELAWVDQIRLKTGCEVEQCLSAPGDVQHLIDWAYGTFSRNEPRDADTASLAWANVLKDVEDSPAVKLVDVLFEQAATARASDIHIDANEQSLFVRFRIDGVLREVPAPPKSLLPAVVSRIKVLAAMDIAETRKPQDGRMKVARNGREIDVRVSTLPSTNGEAVVLRLLNASRGLLSLEELGFDGATKAEFERLIRLPHGMVLVTGPTGSGKTTTLYSALSRVDRVRQSIITLEDPVEIRLPQIRQVAVNPKAGLTFEGGLRAILRQDPDCIMLGEIRDRETAEIALQAALTGHLVLSTLHTNSAAGAVARLRDMGAASFLVASALLGVLAQRLCRRLCENCAAKADPENADTAEALALLGIEPGPDATLRAPTGCKRCGGTGYDGRVGVFELLVVREPMRRAILEDADSNEIAELARAGGMSNMLDDAARKLRAGMTSARELLRILGSSTAHSSRAVGSNAVMLGRETQGDDPFDAGIYEALLRDWLTSVPPPA